MKNNLAVFEEYKICRLYDEETETWFFFGGGHCSGFDTGA